MKIVVGTRGSKLAIIQTNWVVNELRVKHPEVDFSIKIIQTTGDLDQRIPLEKIGDKGIFTKEIEYELLNGTIDLAVHSMKDMPSVLPKGLKLADAPKREDARDVLILREGYSTLEDLPQGAKIGTDSKRRRYQLLKQRPDLKMIPIRGNVDTRIRKLKEENLDGIILAAAGIHRLNRKEEISCYLPIHIVLPAPAQGILALEVRDSDLEVESIINSISDKTAIIQAKAERAFMKALGGSCHIPMGAYCEVEEEMICLKGLYGDEEGQRLIYDSLKGRASEAEKIGMSLAVQMVKDLKKHI